MGMSVRLPVGKIEGGRVIGSVERPLRLDVASDYPLALSFSTLQGYLLADPSYEEGSLADSHATVVGSADGLGKLWSVYKPGGPSLPDKDLRKAIEQAQEHFQHLARLINDATVE